MSAANKSGNNQVSARIRKQIAANAAAIQQKTKDSLELHMVVLDAISEYEAAKQTADSEGKTLADLGRRSKASSDLDGDDGGIDEAAHTAYFKEQVFSKPLPKTCANYKVWGKNLLGDLLYYVCPQNFNLHMVKQARDRDILRQHVEDAFDLVMTGNSSDTTGGILNAEVLVTSLKAIYDKNGRLLDGVTVLPGCIVDYNAPGVGHFTVETTTQSEGVVYMVTCRSLGRSVPIPSELITEFNQVTTTNDIKYNFSRFRAEIDLNPPLRLQNLFPLLGRMLKKRKSEEGAVPSAKRRPRGGILGLAAAKLALAGDRAPSGAIQDEPDAPDCPPPAQALAKQAPPGEDAPLASAPAQVDEIPPPPAEDAK